MEIRTLGPDEKICEPGFYNISLDRHHAQPCDGPSVTSGVLRKMELATPADVWAFHLLNPDRWVQEDKTALRLGRAMAAYIEGGMDEVSKHFAVFPEDRPNRPNANQIANYGVNGLATMDQAFKPLPESHPRRPTDRQIEALTAGKGTDATREAKAFWDDFLADGKVGVTVAQWETMLRQKFQVEFWAAQDADPRDKITDTEQKLIENMGKVLASDPMASAVMGGIPEITMACQDDATGLWLLARPDTVNFDGTVTDYKKINTQGRPFSYRVVDNRITDHGYDMQLAFAAEVFECLTGNWPTSAGIIAQWDAPPHHVILREVSEEDLRFGQFRNRRAIHRFHECLTSGHWPGPGDDVGAYMRPTWQRDMLLAEMNTENKAP